MAKQARTPKKKSGIVGCIDPKDPLWKQLEAIPHDVLMRITAKLGNDTPQPPRKLWI